MSSTLEELEKRVEILERPVPAFNRAIVSKDKMVEMIRSYRLGNMTEGELMALLDLWCERNGHSIALYYAEKYSKK